MRFSTSCFQFAVCLSRFLFGFSFSSSDLIASWETANSEYFLQAINQAFTVCPNLKLCGGLVEKQSIENEFFKKQYAKAMQMYFNLSGSSAADDNPCCEPCSCAEDCVLFHNCCPDYDVPVFINTINYLSACMEGVIIPNSDHLQNLTSFEVPDNRVWAIDKCRVAIMTCGRSYSGFSRTAIVYSAEDNVLYQDQDCANCNGKSNLERFAN